MYTLQGLFGPVFHVRFILLFDTCLYNRDPSGRRRSGEEWEISGAGTGAQELGQEHRGWDRSTGAGTGAGLVVWDVK